MYAGGCEPETLELEGGVGGVDGSVTAPPSGKGEWREKYCKCEQTFTSSYTIIPLLVFSLEINVNVIDTFIFSSLIVDCIMTTKGIHSILSYSIESIQCLHYSEKDWDLFHFNEIWLIDEENWMWYWPLTRTEFSYTLCIRHSPFFFFFTSQQHLSKRCSRSQIMNNSYTWGKDHKYCSFSFKHGFCRLTTEIYLHEGMSELLPVCVSALWHPRHGAASPGGFFFFFFFMAGHVPGTPHHLQHARLVCNDRRHASLPILVSLRKLHVEETQRRLCFFFSSRRRREGCWLILICIFPTDPVAFSPARHLRRRKHLTAERAGIQMPTLLMRVRETDVCTTCTTRAYTGTVYLLGLLWPVWHLPTPASDWQSL